MTAFPWLIYLWLSFTPEGTWKSFELINVNCFFNTNAHSTGLSLAFIGILWTNEDVVQRKREMVCSIIIQTCTVRSTTRRLACVLQETSKFVCTCTKITRKISFKTVRKEKENIQIRLHSTENSFVFSAFQLSVFTSSCRRRWETLSSTLLQDSDLRAWNWF